MQDLTTRLNNYAITCDAGARQAREQAEAFNRKPRTSDPEYNRVMVDQPVKLALAEAETWEKQASEARRGYLVMDVNNIKWQMDPRNRPLIDEALSQNRVIHTGVQADSKDPFWDTRG